MNYILFVIDTLYKFQLIRRNIAIFHFHIDIYFIFLREWKSAIYRLLLNRFYVIQNSRQAPPAVVQNCFENCFCLWWTAFIQTDLSEAAFDFVGAIITARTWVIFERYKPNSPPSADRYKGDCQKDNVSVFWTVKSLLNLSHHFVYTGYFVFV